MYLHPHPDQNKKCRRLSLSELSGMGRRQAIIIRRKAWPWFYSLIAVLLLGSFSFVGTNYEISLRLDSVNSVSALKFLDIMSKCMALES